MEVWLSFVFQKKIHKLLFEYLFSYVRIAWQKEVS